MHFRRLFVLILLVLLSGCSPAQLTPSPDPTLEIWRLQYTPALSWMGSIFNHCTSQQPGVGLLVQEVAAPYLDLQEVDFLVQWGESGEITGYAVELGSDTLVVVVHPENPVGSITLDSLAAIYTGQVSNWNEIDSSLPAEAIAVWSYPEGSEPRFVFDEVLQATGSFAVLHLAPGPGDLREALSDDPYAIGFLPGRWVNDNLRIVEIEGGGFGQLNIPVLGITRTEPEGRYRDWWLCLQAEFVSR